MRPSKTQIVFDSDEFASMLLHASPDPVDVGRVMNFVTRAFELQNDFARPCYIFEVNSAVTEEQLKELSDILTQMKVLAVTVPEGTLNYVCSVTPKSMGVENVKIKTWGLTPMKDRDVD